MNAALRFQNASPTACVALLACACSGNMSLGEGQSHSGGSPSGAIGGSTTTAGRTATGGASAGGASATSNAGGSVSGGVTSTGGSSAATGGSQAVGGTSSATGGSKGAGGTAATTGGTAATTGGTAATTTAGAAGGTAATPGGTAATPPAERKLPEAPRPRVALPGPLVVPTVTLTGTDAVAGTMITFNDNGGWCWYQDERALVDTKANKLLIGSVASGGSRNGYIEAVIYDLAAKTNTLYTVSTSLTGISRRSQCPGLRDSAGWQVLGDVLQPPGRLHHPRQHLRRHEMGGGVQVRLDLPRLSLAQHQTPTRTWSPITTLGTWAPRSSTASAPSTPTMPFFLPPMTARPLATTGA